MSNEDRWVAAERAIRDVARTEIIQEDAIVRVLRERDEARKERLDLAARLGLERREAAKERDSLRARLDEATKARDSARNEASIHRKTIDEVRDILGATEVEIVHEAVARVIRERDAAKTNEAVMVDVAASLRMERDNALAALATSLSPVAAMRKSRDAAIKERDEARNLAASLRRDRDNALGDLAASQKSLDAARAQRSAWMRLAAARPRTIAQLFPVGTRVRTRDGEICTITSTPPMGAAPPVATVQRDDGFPSSFYLFELEVL